MFILPKLGSQVSGAARIVDNAPYAVETVFSTVPYLGYNGAPMAIYSGIEMITSQALSLTNYGTDVLLKDIAVDAHGNVYSVGSKAGYTFVSMSDANGILIWSHVIDAFDTGVLNAVELDSNGNLCIVGTIGSEIIVLQYDPTGVLVWQQQIHSTDSLAGYGIAVDSSNDIIVVGTGSPSGSNKYILLVKYNTTGSIQWQQVINVTGDDVVAYDVDTDASNNIYIAATDTTSLGGLVIQCDPTGAVSNSRLLTSGAGFAGVYGIAVDSSGIIHVATLNNSGLPVMAQLSAELFVNWVWGAADGTGSPGYVPRVAIDGAGNTYMSTQEGAVAMCNSAGVWQWTERFVAFSGSMRMAFDTNGNLYVAGESGYTAVVLDFTVTGSGYPYSEGAYIKFKPAADSSGVLPGAAGPVSMYPSNSSTNESIAITDRIASVGTDTSTAVSTASAYSPVIQPVSSSYFTTDDIVEFGGLVWIKDVSASLYHYLFDTIDNSGNDSLALSTNSPSRLLYSGGVAITFLRNGIWIYANSPELSGNGPSGLTSADSYVAWNFARKFKFFAIETYVGNGTTQVINHTLQVAPGFILIKSTSDFDDWTIYHIGQPGNNAELLNRTGFVFDSSPYKFGNNVTAVAPTAGSFTIGDHPLINNSGSTYTAYLFAHDPSVTGVIQCGTYTGANSADGPVIDLGWEPQYIIIIPQAAGCNTTIFDEERGMTADGRGYATLMNIDTADADYSVFNELKIARLATGFKVCATSGVSSSQVYADLNTAGQTYNYVAIRRGMMTYPQAGTEVFNAVTAIAPSILTDTAVLGFGFNPDLLISTNLSDSAGFSSAMYDKLRGVDATYDPPLFVGVSGSESETEYMYLNTMKGFNADGFNQGGNVADAIWFNAEGRSYVYWGFKRAPGFFDQVCYTGNGSSQTISHNLAATPELMFVFNRSTGDKPHCAWSIEFSGSYISVDNTVPVVDTAHTYFGNGTGPVLPTETDFTVGTSLSTITGDKQVAYLFASLPGVSRISTYIGNGANQDINCGFSNAARFVLIKNLTANGDWLVWDYARGISSQAGGGTLNSPFTTMNSMNVEVTDDNGIYSLDTGFTVHQTSTSNTNVADNTYLFFAIS